MNFPADLLYTPEHEWIRFEADDTATIGITDFAQSELGDIVYVDIEKKIGSKVAQNEVFGTVEAVKTVSDLYLPISGEILAINTELNNNPEAVNTDPYNTGWIVKIIITNTAETTGLLSVSAYKTLIGK